MIMCTKKHGEANSVQRGGGQSTVLGQSRVKVGVEFSVAVHRDAARELILNLRQILDDLGLADKVQIQDS